MGALHNRWLVRLQRGALCSLWAYLVVVYVAKKTSPRRVLLHGAPIFADSEASEPPEGRGPAWDEIPPPDQDLVALYASLGFNLVRFIPTINPSRSYTDPRYRSERLCVYQFARPDGTSVLVGTTDGGKRHWTQDNR